MENFIKKELPIRTLTCNCCGNGTKGRQWWNRDAGYGLCISCGNEQEKKFGVDIVKDWCGKRGYNWDIK